jgi:hypothetical protein
MRNNKNSKKPDDNNSFTLPQIEPWHRLSRGGPIHTIGNRIGGVFSWSKKEWHKMIEERNRANKQRKLKQKTK